MGSKSSKSPESTKHNSASDSEHDEDDVESLGPLKALVIGAPAIGKSTFVRALMSVAADPASVRALDDYVAGDVTIDGTRVQVQLSEPSLKRHRRLSVSTYAQMHGVVVCYSLESAESLTECQAQAADISTFAPDVPIVLVGLARSDERSVKRSVGEKAAKDCHARYLEVNSMQRAAVRTAVTTLIPAMCHFALYGSVPAHLGAGDSSTPSSPSTRRSVPRMSLKSSKSGRELADSLARPRFEVRLDEQETGTIVVDVDDSFHPFSPGRAGEGVDETATGADDDEELDADTAAMLAAMEAAEKAAVSNMPATEAYEALLRSDQSRRLAAEAS
eukprot:CAMPEP_0170743022 /NCGR_PEP_ID=MMETSP0437-20130122/7050_1 /TAXON_ID=0 /ORGANISM="Sexangularia sp." /LENGTH=331 /DNA_ID=CAMNT_0011081671 /DNA_START=1 /DNA_END=997 /DNA_ORIENTATION=+